MFVKTDFMILGSVVVVIAARVETPLPARPLESSRVILAPCSPLMATQQQWSFPTGADGARLQLLLRNGNGNGNDGSMDGQQQDTARPLSSMYLEMEQSPTEASLLGVVRSSSLHTSGTLWTFNTTLDVLQLVNTNPTGTKCLTTLQNGQFTTVAAGECPKRSWRSNTDDLAYGISSLYRNASDSTIRFVHREAYVRTPS